MTVSSSSDFTPPVVTSSGCSSQGFILVLTIAISFVLSLLTVSILSVASAKYSKTKADINDTAAMYAAEAGISDTVAQLDKTSGSFSGYGTEKVFYSNARQGKATYTTKVTRNGDETLTVESTGLLYRHNVDTTSFMQKTLRAIVKAETIPMTAGNILAGNGGIYIENDMSSSLSTRITKGDVYTLGKITLKGNAGASIGTPTGQAVTVAAANIGCGTATNWPQACPSNDPPIKTTSGFFTPGQPMVYGTVCATNQPTSSFIQPGTGLGLQAGCKAPEMTMPTFDKAAFTSATTKPMPSSVPDCNSGDPTWPAGVRIDGGLLMNSQPLRGPCTVTLEGDVYIKGNVWLGGSLTFKVAESAGTRSPTMVVNGSVVIYGSGSPGGGFIANSHGAHINLVSFDSANSACSNSDTCNSLPPQDIYNSVIPWTDANCTGAGINIGCGGSYPGNHATDLSGLSAYAYFGGISYNMGGGKSLRGIGGQRIKIVQWFVGSDTDSLITATDPAPFSWMYTKKHKLIDYIPVYN